MDAKAFDRKAITLCESHYEEQIREAVNSVVESGRHIILLAGASCAGKTTTSLKLAKEIRAHGLMSETVSLDDFYLQVIDEDPYDDIPPNYEAPECLDLPLIAEVFDALSAGRAADVPVFDFKIKNRLSEFRRIPASEKTVTVFEGLHALNPGVLPASPETAYRIYLKCESPDYDAKLLRRIVRDLNYREASAELTFSLWKNVKDGEAAYIRPYESQADAVIKTYFDYEPSAFKDEAEAALSAVPADSVFRAHADKLAEFLSGTVQLDTSLIPSDSLLREFIVG